MFDIYKTKNIIFDFDGVIVDSNYIKEQSFKESLSEFNEDLVNKFIKYHRNNLGIDRYTKIDYFIKSILKSDVNIDKKKILNNFSRAVKHKITKKILIKKTIDFITSNKKIKYYIVSSADEKEIRKICKKLEINDFFLEILGSPIIKENQIKNVINTHKLIKKETIYIGDTIHDYNSARKNGIEFYGFNNSELKDKGLKYISNYQF